MYGEEMVAAFADDLLVALTDGQDPDQLITLLEDWTSLNKMDINKKKGKSAYIQITKRSNGDVSNTEENFRGIYRQKEYKYLGTVIRENADYCDSLASASKSICWERRKFKIAKTGLNIQEQLNIWKTYMGSKTNHSLMTLLFCSKTSQNKIQAKFSKALKSAVGCPSTVNNDKVYFVVNTLSPIEYAKKFLLRTIIKLLEFGHEIKELKDMLGKIGF